MLEEEEMMLVHRGVSIEMEEILAGAPLSLFLRI
jgi:hypothetical protein